MRGTQILLGGWLALLVSCGSSRLGDDKGSVGSTSLGGAGPACSSWGWYCGGANLGGGDPTHLYYCPKNATTTIDLGACGDHRCVVAPAGQPDFCDGGSSKTTQVRYAGFGWWCGGSGTPLGDGQSDHLYFFDDNFPTDLGRCSSGCSVNPNSADTCKPVAPPPVDAGVDSATLPDCPCFAGDGVYCGTSIVDYGGAHHCSAPALGSNSGNLYTCTGGKWAVQTSCGAAGCFVAPAGTQDGCHFAGATKNLWIVFQPSAIRRDLPGLFQCLLGRSDFSDRSRQYPNGYGLTWGGSVVAGCAGGDYGCAVAALRSSGAHVSDHDVIEIVVHGYCGGDNNARGDGVVAGGTRIRGGNVGDCPGAPAEEERVAVHEAFESSGHWANADCCTGEVNPSACADNGEAFCPDCPCSCGRYQSDGSYGGQRLDCGNGRIYWSQRVPSSSGREFDPNACAPFTLLH